MSKGKLCKNKFSNIISLKLSQNRYILGGKKRTQIKWWRQHHVCVHFSLLQGSIIMLIRDYKGLDHNTPTPQKKETQKNKSSSYLHRRHECIIDCQWSNLKDMKWVSWWVNENKWKGYKKNEVRKKEVIAIIII